ncbi:M1 family metallopeptidase [Ammoniphilus sp. YIM 78166]|uniref:M1 family metallopeptidase n=1 Tax=Ammoniphilus sp. YIM 78166 TaxID=1644106 RepID=UPI00106FAA04|nr:M1 family metallopeptidase [Ammoniphilus sp. YIM 78166]
MIGRARILSIVLLSLLMACNSHEPTEETVPAALIEQEMAVSVPMEPKPPHYQHKLTYESTKNILIGETTIQAWNRTSIPTDELNIQLFLSAFEPSQKQPPVLPKSFSRAYPHGVQYGRMDIQEVQVDGFPVSFHRDGAILKVELQQPWSANTPREIQLQWTGQLPGIHHRLGSEKEAAWFGNVLPILSVYDGEWRVNQYEAVGDPFFSEAGSYEVEVTVPDSYHVVMTGEEEASNEQGSSKTVSKVDRAREFVFAITPNHQQESIRTSSGKDIHLYHRTLSKQTVSKVLQEAKGMLDYMESRVGTYPYQQLDIFENEMFITGMEYPGLVFVRSDRLQDPKGIETVVHEIAHQWFYNIVGNDPLNEPWLDEGFATYFADEYLQGAKLPSYYAEEKRYLDRHFPQTKIQPIHHYPDWASYWRGNYRKSSLMIFALQQELGEEAFSRFLKEYVQEFEYQIVTKDEFVAFVKGYAEKDMDSFFQDWFK